MSDTKKDSKRIIEDKVYRIVRKADSHVNTKLNSDGSKSAIQFSDDANDLTGPVDLIEVDESEYVRTEYIEITPPPRTMGQIVVEDVITPIAVEAVQHVIEIGVIYFQRWMEQTAIPQAKKKTKKWSKNVKNAMARVKYGLAGKEQKVTQIISINKETTITDVKKTSIQTVEPVIKDSYPDKTERTSEEIQYIINTMKSSAVTLAACIRMLNNSIIATDDMNESNKLEFQHNLEVLTTEGIMNHIDVFLDDKNKGVLDQASIQMLSAFREGNLIVNDQRVPIAKYLKVN